MAYYHCLLFDLDGTLLDFGAAEDAAIHETLAYYGFAQPQEAVDAYKQINSALWAALERGEVRQEKLVVQRFEKLLADFGVQGDACLLYTSQRISSLISANTRAIQPPQF